MSLNTPVFPSLHGKQNNGRRDSPAVTSTLTPKKQQNYIELLRDLHLFLSTKDDVLSPPSRPNSPTFDHRVQKLEEAVREAFDAAGGEPADGRWTHVSQMLKMGCVRRRYWSVYEDDERPTEEDVEWILPDGEEEWIEWEKKRQENRGLKGKTKASQQIGGASSSVAPNSGHPNLANLVELGKSQGPVLEGAVQPVSPTTLHKANEKVRRWQATMDTEISPDTAIRSSPASTNAGAAKPIAKGAPGQQKSHALGFPVVKRVVASTMDKKGKGHVGRPTISGPSQDRSDPLGSPKSSKPPNLPLHPAAPTKSDGIDTVSLETPVKASLVAKDMPKVTDFPESPYLPPSFPSHLETSTPLPQMEHAVPVRAKPPPILPIPLSSSTPPPSTPSVKSTADRTHIQEEPHAAKTSLSLPLQIDDPQPIKRPFSLSRDDAPNGPPVTPPAKRLRTIPQSLSLALTPPPVSNDSPSISPNMASRGVHISPSNGVHDSNLALHSNSVDPRETALDYLEEPLAPDKSDQVHDQDLGLPEKIPSPAKSTRSFFSAPDSDTSNSPIHNHNLLLHSPVSPMLSFAQNPNAFLPQYTSTQLGQNYRGRTSSGIFGMGYNSQFDVEKHVDRVSELLEKDVDFDGWLRDVPAVEEIDQ
ncbi:hypothetical protein BU15DRAFT_74778 [Melanogaster broomeanus]|nr:hypothetical protein BU15DRAFT_74778 [Melanogaster broomeanus]